MAKDAGATATAEKPAAAKKQGGEAMATVAARTALSEAKEKRLAKVATELYPENDEMAKGTIVYGRKLLKFAAGTRTSKPPVPPALQASDKKTTMLRLVSIAKALDIDPEKVGLGDAPKAEPTKKAEPKKETAAKAATAKKTAAAKPTRSTPKAAAKPSAPVATDAAGTPAPPRKTIHQGEVARVAS